MPTEQRLRCGEERAPGWPRQPSAQRREQQPVAPSPTGSPDLALGHAKLMPENEDLQVEITLRTRAADEGTEYEPREEVEESKNHDRESWQVRACPSHQPMYRLF